MRLRMSAADARSAVASASACGVVDASERRGVACVCVWMTAVRRSMSGDEQTGAAQCEPSRERRAVSEWPVRSHPLRAHADPAVRQSAQLHTRTLVPPLHRCSSTASAASPFVPRRPQRSAAQPAEPGI